MAENKQKTVIYFYPRIKSTFIIKDIRLLSDTYIVKDYFFDTSNKKLLFWELFKQKLFIFKNIFSSDVYLIKFAGYWSLIPVMMSKIFGKRAIIITGGSDCVSFPEFNYGNYQNKLMSISTKLSFRWADRIIALHPTMMFREYTYFDSKIKKQGIKAHIKNLKTPFSVAYNGFNPEFWKKINKKQKDVFLTVTSGFAEKQRRLIKGVDIILEVAPFFPDKKFIIIGVDDGDYDVPDNVILKPKASAEVLRDEYSKATFYLQLSISEGFPNALCEAMLCECVPVVSDVISMPSIIGDTGFVLKKKSTEMLKDLLSEALESDVDALAIKARNRVIENYTEDIRQRNLVNAISSVF